MSCAVLGGDVLLALLDERSPDHDRALAAVAEARGEGHGLAVCASTYTELVVGAAEGDDPEVRGRLDAELARLAAEVVPLDASVARFAADLRSAHPDVPLHEALLVATAQVLDAARILSFECDWERVDDEDGAAGDRACDLSAGDVAAALAQAQADAAEARNTALFESPPGRRAALAAAAFVRLLDAAERDIQAHGGTVWHVRLGRSGDGRGIRIAQHLIDLIGQEDGTLRVRVRRYRSGRAYEFDEVALPGIEPAYDVAEMPPDEVEAILERIALAFVTAALGIAPG